MAASSSQADSTALPFRTDPSPRGPSGFVIEELSSEETGEEGEEMWEDYAGSPPPMSNTGTSTLRTPDLFTTYPPIRDLWETETSYAQYETIQECLPYLSGTSGEFDTYNDHGIPPLLRARHIRFLHKTLQDLPSGYVAADAARPWFFYWALCGLHTFGEDVTQYRDRLVSTVRPMQNAMGGFAGGHEQMSHLAPTYAIVLALSMVGGEEALEVIDRKAMWQWLGAVKQPDGGFQMSVGGEEDVR
jgi:protein farnesyltransferase subunit beta